MKNNLNPAFLPANKIAGNKNYHRNGSRRQNPCESGFSVLRSNLKIN